MTSTQQDVRPLIAEELDAVTGGMQTEFYYGNMLVGIKATNNQVWVCVTDTDTMQTSHRHMMT